jgi:hypothetical protein
MAPNQVIVFDEMADFTPEVRAELEKMLTEFADKHAREKEQRRQLLMESMKEIRVQHFRPQGKTLMAALGLLITGSAPRSISGRDNGYVGQRFTPHRSGGSTYTPGRKDSREYRRRRRQIARASRKRNRGLRDRRHVDLSRTRANKIIRRIDQLMPLSRRKANRLRTGEALAALIENAS